jgi:hypothetical protein
MIFKKRGKFFQKKYWPKEVDEMLEGQIKLGNHELFDLPEMVMKLF